MKLLIVEDNKTLATMFSKMVNIAGHESTVVNDGRNALSLIKNEKFDIIVMDLGMPEFSGFDLIDALEKDGLMKENKIVVLTASLISSEKEEAIKKQGVKYVLRKPIKSDALCSTLSKLSEQ